MSDATGRRVKELIDLLDTLEKRSEAGAGLAEIGREVIGVFLRIPRPIRIQLGLRHLVVHRLSEHYDIQGWRSYPRLAASWDCGPTAVLDAVDRLAAASLAADPFYILDSLDEIHLLIGSGLVGQCAIHSSSHHGNESAA